MSISDTTSPLNRPTSDKTISENGRASANELANGAHRNAEDLASAAKAEFNNIMADLQELVRRAGKLSGQELTALREQISEKLGLAREKLNHLGEDASVAAQKGLGATEEMIKTHPFQSIGIAALVGVAVGVLLNRR